VTDDQQIADQTILQMPLVLGAMSAFHSIPREHVGTAGLELTPCMLGKIFSRQITTWDNEELREGGLNQGLATVGHAIVVYRRDSGSSTTNFFTKYLHESTRTECSGAWTIGWGPALNSADDVLEYANVEATWETGTVGVSGSSGMSSNIAAHPYGASHVPTRNPATQVTRASGSCLIEPDCCACSDRLH
jgi:ABC-type phosphate transport system substrate-binding protein